MFDTSPKRVTGWGNARAVAALIRRTIASMVLVPALLLGPGAERSSAATHKPVGAVTHVLLVLNHPTSALAKFVADVSDPASGHYRRFLTIEQLARRFGATRSTQHAVARWLRVHGARARFDTTATYVDVTVTVAQKRALFPTASAARAGGRSALLAVPPALAGSVSGVLDGETPIPGGPPGENVRADPLLSPLNPQGSSIRRRTGTPAGCAAGVNDGSVQRAANGFEGFTPNQYLTADGFPRLIRQDLRGSGERAAVVEFGGFRSSDIATFARCFSLPVPSLNVIPVQVPRPLPPLDETTLDLEVLSAAAPRVTSIDVYEGQLKTIAGLVNTIAEPLRQRSRRPNVESISYGFCEPLFAGAIPVMRAVNTVLEFEAAAGISVFVAAGDTGSSGCSSNQNSQALPLQSVSFPASSPYATAVGGLNLTLTPGNHLAGEVVWNNSPLAFGAGGGGPSLIFDRPSWQAVPGAASVMREVPDVAMLADDVPGYAIYCSPPACKSPVAELTPGWIDVGGTSAAAPLLAAGAADADQEAARHHQPPLGFVNPLLYDVAGASRLGVISDVLHGNNDLGTLIDGMPIGCCSVHRGYDAASGLGSVDVDAFSRAALRAYRHALPAGTLRRGPAM